MTAVILQILCALLAVGLLIITYHLEEGRLVKTVLAILVISTLAPAFILAGFVV